MKTLFFTVLALLAFAANSVLCRLALGADKIDAASFTVIRLLAGTIVLMLVLTLSNSKAQPVSKGSYLASMMLFVYAACFSYAYLSLDTATGALILFGSVQITMILWSVIAGERLGLAEWAGLAMAFSGFVYLVLPDVSRPSLFGFVLMVVAGIGWGIYTLKGRGSANPLMDTSYNFLRTLPLCIILLAFTLSHASYSSEGIVLAIISGGISSGLGYTIWYLALRRIATTTAAVVQLLVPVIAAVGGVVFVAEPLSFRLMFSGLIIMGGIALVVWARNRVSSG